MKKLSFLFTALLVCVSSIFAAGETTKEYTFSSKTLPTGWTTTGSFYSSYYKMSKGNYAEVTASTLFAENRLNSDMTINVACGTFGTWKSDKTIKLTAAFYDKDGKVLTSTDYTTGSLNSAETTYRGDFTLKMPDVPADIASLRITFTSLNSGSEARLGKIKLIYKTGNACSGYAITLSTNPKDAGTVSANIKEACEGDIVTLTAVANESYVFDKWFAIDENANEITITDNQFTMPASAVEVEGSFREKEIYEVTWLVNGEAATGKPTTVVIEGKKVEALPDEPTSCEKGKTFIGWTDVEITNTNVPEVLFSKTEDAPVVTKNTTYYAVFAVLDEAGYTKLQAINNEYTISNGKYLMVATTSTNSSYACAGKKADKNYGDYTSVTIIDDNISEKPENAVELTITITDENTNKFSIYDGTYWLSANSSSNEFYYYTTESSGKDAWNIDKSNGYISSASNSKYIMFNENSGQERFASYKSSVKGTVYTYLYKSNISYGNCTTSLDCTPSETENTSAKTATAAKVLENGQLYIICDGVRYNAQGMVME